MRWQPPARTVAAYQHTRLPLPAHMPAYCARLTACPHARLPCVSTCPPNCLPTCPPTQLLQACDALEVMGVLRPGVDRFSIERIASELLNSFASTLASAENKSAPPHSTHTSHLPPPTHTTHTHTSHPPQRPHTHAHTHTHTTTPPHSTTPTPTTTPTPILPTIIQAPHAPHATTLHLPLHRHHHHHFPGGRTR